MTGSTAKYKVLVTDYVWANLEPEREVLAGAGAEVIASESPEEGRLAELAADCDGIMTCFAKVTGKVIRSAPRLKIVARYGVGVDNIDVIAATELGVPVTYVPDYCVEEVADHCMALLLALARGISRLGADVKAGGWDLAAGRPIHRLRGRRLGILGLGRIGRALAERATAFGLDVVAHDPYLDAAAFAKVPGIRQMDFEELLRTSDYVSVHAPLTPQTRHLIGKAQLEQMRRSAFLINASRGPVVDEMALAAALNAGAIAGAGIDVLEREPPPKDHPLRSARNAILTPHAAFYSEEAVLELQQRTAASVADVLTGKEPRHIWNRDALSAARKKH